MGGGAEMDVRGSAAAAGEGEGERRKRARTAARGDRGMRGGAGADKSSAVGRGAFAGTKAVNACSGKKIGHKGTDAKGPSRSKTQNVYTCAASTGK